MELLFWSAGKVIRDNIDVLVLIQIIDRPEGGVLQKFEEWKIAGRAPEPRVKKIRIPEHQSRVDEEAETDSRRDSPSLSVASSPASSIDLEYSRGAEYRQSCRRSYLGYRNS